MREVNIFLYKYWNWQVSFMSVWVRCHEHKNILFSVNLQTVEMWRIYPKYDSWIFLSDKIWPFEARPGSIWARAALILWLDNGHYYWPSLNLTWPYLINEEAIHGIDRKLSRSYYEISHFYFLWKALLSQNHPIVFAFSWQLSILAPGSLWIVIYPAPDTKYWSSIFHKISFPSLRFVLFMSELILRHWHGAKKLWWRHITKFGVLLAQGVWLLPLDELFVLFKWCIILTSLKHIVVTIKWVIRIFKPN